MTGENAATPQPPSLFVPEAYRAPDPGAIVRAYPFATLTTATPAGIHATQTPIFFEHDDDEGTLVGHLARRNPHAAALKTGQAALALFTGPHAYVSPRWYLEKPQVPTWIYVSAQVRGALEPIDDDESQLAILRRSVHLLEPEGNHAWTLDHAPEGRVAKLLPMIRSFRIRVDALEGVTKLSQTHPPGDRRRVTEALAQSEDSRPVARLMADLYGYD